MTHFKVSQYVVGGPMWIEVNPIQLTPADRQVDILLELSEDEARLLCLQIFDVICESAITAGMTKFSKEPR